MIRALAVVLAVARRSRQNHLVPTLEVYPFRFRDPLTGKWARRAVQGTGARAATLLCGVGDHGTAGDSPRHAGQRGAVQPEEGRLPRRFCAIYVRLQPLGVGRPRLTRVVNQGSVSCKGFVRHCTT